MVGGGDSFSGCSDASLSTRGAAISCSSCARAAPARSRACERSTARAAVCAAFASASRCRSACASCSKTAVSGVLSGAGALARCSTDTHSGTGLAGCGGVAGCCCVSCRGCDRGRLGVCGWSGSSSDGRAAAGAGDCKAAVAALLSAEAASGAPAAGGSAPGSRTDADVNESASRCSSACTSCSRAAVRGVLSAAGSLARSSTDTRVGRAGCATPGGCVGGVSAC